MKLVLTSCFSLLLFASCKTHAPEISSTPADPQINPGSCRIEASIVEVLAPTSEDTSDICFKNSCDAIVHVDKIRQCGSTAWVIPNEKGEIKVHFPNSLNPANKDSNIKPKNGLTKGSFFSAVVEARQAPGDVTNYVIYIYEIK